MGFLFFFGSRERRFSIERRRILGRVRRNSIVVPCCFQEEDVKMTEGGEGFLTSSFFFSFLLFRWDTGGGSTSLARG